MSLLSRLRAAARQATETTIEYAGGDPAEVFALVQHMAKRENCTAECTTFPDRPCVLGVRFVRCVAPSC